MNPGEQDRNPFRRTYSAGSRTGRYIGGRPDFFAQAMAQNSPAPAPVQKKRINKKPIFIGLGIIAAIVLVIVSVVMVAPSIGNLIASGDKNHDLTELQKVISEYYDDALNAYLTIKSASNSDPLWIPGESDEYVKKTASSRNQSYTRIKEFKDKIEKFGGVTAYDYFGNSYDIDTRLKIAKEKLNKYIEAFEKINGIYTVIIEAYNSNGAEDKIKAIGSKYSDEEMSEIANVIDAYYKVYKDYESKPGFKDCIEDTDDECKIDLTRLNNAAKKLTNNQALANILAKTSKQLMTEEQEDSLINTLSEIRNAHKEKENHE